MKLLTRYVVREHVGPLAFALTALTSLLMLQYVARQLANLAGKGLPWSAIGQFFVLSLPFTIAMTMPMAVLVATLYAFGRMAAEHEITAFKASGVRVRALMLPVLGCALLLSIGMVAFNDQVMPRANHRLRILQQDISRTKPTLALHDQVLNPLTDQFFMRVARSDAATNKMWNVEIYDLSHGIERKTIYADSGTFSLAPNGQDLQLQLYDGHSQEFVKGDARRLQRTYFRTQAVKVRGISQSFRNSRADSYKGDREMTVCEMQRKYNVSAIEFARTREDYINYASRVAKPGQKTITVPRSRPRTDVLATLYCTGVPGLITPKAAKAQSAPTSYTAVGALAPAGAVGVQPPVVQPPVVQTPVAQPAVVPGPNPAVVVPAAVVPAQPAVPTPAVPSPAVPGGGAPMPAVIVPVAPVVSATDSAAMARGSMLAATAQMDEARDAIDGLRVEIHKKFALSFACLVFVLFGPPIALRFPRGGVGVTLGVSLIVFGLYYICLMAGEALADKGRLSPPIAMWMANLIFGTIGLVLMSRVESTTDSSRGGGLREWWSDRRARRELSSTIAAEPGAAVRSAAAQPDAVMPIAE